MSFFEETGRVSSGFPGCTRDDGTAMNSVFNSITSIVLVMHVVLNVINSINNNNNNNDNNNNNNDNNNVSRFEFYTESTALYLNKIDWQYVISNSYNSVFILKGDI